MSGGERKAEFDKLSRSYEDLLRDPIRDRFAGESIFFHLRKRDLIRDFFRRTGRDAGSMSYLDIGCGKGELLSLLRGDFARVSGCDPSKEMSAALEGRIDWRHQVDMDQLPFADNQFDFATAVCVYHHVPVEARARITAEVHRVLKPGGLFAIVEHNPYNPATRLIVSRTPVDENAILLAMGETKRWMAKAGFTPVFTPYFLFLPRPLYEKMPWLERWIEWLPMGGQYAVIAKSNKAAANGQGPRAAA